MMERQIKIPTTPRGGVFLMFLIPPLMMASGYKIAQPPQAVGYQKQMKILMLTPEYYPAICGNAIVVDRIRRKLKRNGIKVDVVVGAKVKNNILKKYTPDIIHAFHARKSNIFLIKEVLKKNNVPYMVTLTGTDFNVDVHDKRKRKIIKQVIENAACITSFDNNAKKVLADLNIHAKRFAIIPQGEPLLKKTSFNIKKYFNIREKDFLVLLVAGLRPVKNVLYAIKEFAQLKPKQNKVHLVILGRIYDRNYYKLISQYIKELSIANIYFGKISHDDMHQAYAGADLIINTSVSESMSTALVEAKYLGCPICAVDISGNHFLPKSALFPKRKGALTEAILKKMEKKKGRKLRKRKLREKKKDAEADAYIAVYKQIL